MDLATNLVQLSWPPRPLLLSGRWKETSRRASTRSTTQPSRGECGPSRRSTTISSAHGRDGAIARHRRGRRGLATYRLVRYGRFRGDSGRHAGTRRTGAPGTGAVLAPMVFACQKPKRGSPTSMRLRLPGVPHRPATPSKHWETDRPHPPVESGRDRHQMESETAHPRRNEPVAPSPLKPGQPGAAQDDFSFSQTA